MALPPFCKIVWPVLAAWGLAADIICVRGFDVDLAFGVKLVFCAGGAAQALKIVAAMIRAYCADVLCKANLENRTICNLI